MNLFIFVFLGVVMLSGNTFAVPLSEERRGDECQVHLKTTSPGDDVPEGWKAVNGFQKCYFYQMSKGHVKYQDANQFCQQPGVVGSRLFTPGSLDEMKKVAAAMIPESVTGDARNYWTGFVEFDWQLWKEGPLLFAANAYPFEPMPEGMWNAGQPNDNLPYMEPCTASAGDGIQDGGCINDWFAGQTIICEAAWNVETPASKRGDANLMQNARERGQANPMHNAQERGQANMERRTVDCEEPWKAVSGFPDKCYLYLYSTSTMEYETSNALCTERHQWSRLFTPMSMQELDSVELALIPDTVREAYSGRFYTSFVKFASEDGNATQFASNSFPFEGLNKTLWAHAEPSAESNPLQTCVLAKRKDNDDREGLCNVPCTANGWSGNSVVCEVARMN